MSATNATPDAIDERLRKADEHACCAGPREARIRAIDTALGYRELVESARELLRCTDELRPAIDALERLRRALGDTDA